LNGSVSDLNHRSVRSAKSEVIIARSFLLLTFRHFSLLLLFAHFFVTTGTSVCQSKSIMSSLSLTARDRVAGALWGMFIGDALSMPVHWIYDPDALRREYGVVRDYLPPKRSHPSSIMSLHSADRAGRKTAGHNKAAPVRRIVGDVILKGRRHLWEEPKLHYHFGLQAGDNTLNLLIARVLMRSIATRGRYDADHFLEQYIAFMTAGSCSS
jgi:hypothetical protein